jgi:hypothetical protein
MRYRGRFSLRYLRLGVIGILLAGGSYAGSFDQEQAGTKAALATQIQTILPLSADDVSWLFPVPTRAEDFARLIAVRELSTQNSKDSTKRDPIWPDAAFQQFIKIAASSAAEVAGPETRIGLPTEAQSIDAWFIAGIRIDAGAPGLSNEIRAQFGRLPEIRLIIQPVTRNPDGTPNVHDIAGHLIFDFTLEKPNPAAQAGCFPRPLPDIDAFNAIIRDLAALRSKLSDGQFGKNKVITEGVPLGIHPGLADATTENSVRDEMKAFLERHISGQRLDAMSIVGLTAGGPAPWIFLSMQKVSPGPNGQFVPVPGPTLDGKQFAQMLQPAGVFPRVAPVPHTDNLNPITCKNAAVPAGSPIKTRSGVSTADVFVAMPPPADKVRKVLDVIADPVQSHFFNTDCVSCHTETRRAMELLKSKDFPCIDSAALPDDAWNVRNFGWSPSAKGSFEATVTRRTANETAAVVAFINSELLKQLH